MVDVATDKPAGSAGALSAAVAPPPLAFDAERAALLGRFVASAYTMYHNDPSQLIPPASADFPPDYRLVASLQMKDFVLTSTGPVFYGFIVQSKADESRYVLAIRGTSDWTEWWDDANAGSATPFRVPGCGSVGSGFARIYDTLEVIDYPSPSPFAAARPLRKHAGGFAAQVRSLVSRTLPSVSPLAEAAPASPVISVVGHSLGAALATMYVLENAKTEAIHNPLLCTFASPRVGDASFVAAFNALRLTSWRVVNGPDLVPHLPPTLVGFSHVDTLHAVSSTGKVRPSIVCWHVLPTYLSLIDPSAAPSAECSLSPVHAPAAEAFPVGLRPVPSVSQVASNTMRVSVITAPINPASDEAAYASNSVIATTFPQCAAPISDVTETTPFGAGSTRGEDPTDPSRTTLSAVSIIDGEERAPLVSLPEEAVNYAVVGDIYPSTEWMASHAGRNEQPDPSLDFELGFPELAAAAEIDVVGEVGGKLMDNILGNPNWPSRRVRPENMPFGKAPDQSPVGAGSSVAAVGGNPDWSKPQPSGDQPPNPFAPMADRND